MSVLPPTSSQVFARVSASWHLVQPGLCSWDMVIYGGVTNAGRSGPRASEALAWFPWGQCAHRSPLYVPGALPQGELLGTGPTSHPLQRARLPLDGDYFYLKQGLGQVPGEFPGLVMGTASFPWLLGSAPHPLTPGMPGSPPPISSPPGYPGVLLQLPPCSPSQFDRVHIWLSLMWLKNSGGFSKF